METHGFLRVAAASPELRLADCPFNADRTLALMARAEGQGVNVVVFPECGLTGYTCHDLFHHHTLLKAARDALHRVVERRANVYRGVAVVGLPLAVDGQVYNCAAVIHDGEILGIVPKTYLPNYKEFYDARYFCPADSAVFTDVKLDSSGEETSFRHEPAVRVRQYTRLHPRGGNLRRPVDAGPAQLAGGRDGCDRLRQPLGQQRGDRQGGLPSATRHESVRALPGGVRLFLVRGGRILHRHRLRRALPDRGERHAAGGVGAVSPRRSPAR